VVQRKNNIICYGGGIYLLLLGFYRYLQYFDVYTNNFKIPNVALQILIGDPYI